MFVHVLATHDTSCKLQVAAFAQLAVVGRGSNTLRLCHSDFYDV